MTPALDLPPEERGRFLDRECAGNVALRLELESLLAAHASTGPLDRPIPRFGEAIGDALGVNAPGSRVSHYEIDARLGSGGMGVVYRARDLRLGRTVALKFLPSKLSGDSHAKKRFLTEARAAAALEHANVCAVHEIGETDEGRLFIAMAFVEGQSLRDLIERGPLPVDQAIDIAGQIARGLDCAHRHGIVHRDVKPANVMVGANGVVRLVDFGVAKLAGSTLTNAGATPGTTAYMSPEQAQGEEVDHRTDLWALGVVLFEMLTGQRPFPGATDAVVLHAITTRSAPNVRTLRADIPGGLEAIVSGALEKPREQRFQSAQAMDEALEAARRGSPFRIPRFRRIRRLSWGAITFTAVTLAIAMTAGAILWRRSSTSPPAEMLRVSISAPGTVTPQLSAAISPNGRYVAFVATSTSRGAMLWVRALDQLEARALPGTERAAHPFWSPDGRSLGFIADNQIKRVDLAGGPVEVVADSVLRWGPAWGPDGTILFIRRRDEIAAVPATGGRVTTVAKTDPTREQTTLGWPRFLPDGRHFIYFADSRQAEHRGIYTGSLDSKETKFILRNDFRAWYAPPGYLVFARDEAIVAQSFDAMRLELSGEPTVVADGVWFARTAGQASFSVSETGALAYVNSLLWDGELAWFDRSGRPVGSAGPPVRYEGLTPQVAPDGRRVAVARGEYGGENIWIVGATGDNATRLSFGSNAGASLPVWSSNGRRVMYKAGQRLIIKGVDDGAEEIVRDPLRGVLQDWSRDGRFVVVQRVDGHTDLWAVRLDTNGAPFPLTQTPYNETQAQLSPDGGWIAYTSNETGRDEVYVQAFPVSRGKRQVSTDGGAMPRWRKDGKELFYLAGNQFITTIPVVDIRSLELGQPTPLFRTRLVVEGSESITLATKYDVAPNGDRFLLRYPPAEPGPPITVVINWTRALTKE